MYYIIMNYNLLENFQMGIYNTLSKLFYVGRVNIKETSDTDFLKIEWSPSIADAYRFRNEINAWETAIKIWGIDFVIKNLSIISVRKELMERSVKIKSQILISEQFKNDLLKKNDN